MRIDIHGHTAKTHGLVILKIEQCLKSIIRMDDLALIIDDVMFSGILQAFFGDCYFRDLGCIGYL